MGYASIHAPLGARVSSREAVVHKADAGKVHSTSCAFGTRRRRKYVSHLQIAIKVISDHDRDTVHSIHQLLSTFAEFVKQSAARVDELRSELGSSLRYVVQQERLTSAMAISLFAVSKARIFAQQLVSRYLRSQAADIAHSTIHPQRAVAFRPQTMATAMQLLRFILNEGGHTTPMDVLNPPDHLDIPTSVVIRWGVVPQWTWSIWVEYSNLHADTIMCVVSPFPF